jgi:hypothetical protein
MCFKIALWWNLFNVSYFSFRAWHKTTQQYVRLIDHVTLNFEKSMSTAAVFLVLEKVFDKTWHFGLLYKLCKLQFSTNVIKFISPFYPSEYSVSVEGEIPTPREIQATMLQSFVQSPNLYIMYIMYINNTPKTLCVYLALFADDTYMHAMVC